MEDIQSLFERIQQPTFTADGTHFVAVAISGYPHFHLAKDSDQSPSLLISVTDGIAKSSMPPIALEHLSVTFDIPCRISKSDGVSVEGVFTVIRCIGQERLLHTYFLRAIRVLFDLLPSAPTKSEVGQAVGTLVELFRSITSPAKKTLQGLWAELLVIDSVSRPELLVAAWHATPYDRFDFNAGNERLEIKSTSYHSRQHHFALDQLTSIEGTTVVIASLFTERTSRGATVMELVDNVRKKLYPFPALIEHLDRIVTATLGNNWRAALDEPFDKQLALHTLQFYNAAVIPTILLPLPIGISDVHFKVDLTPCVPLEVTSFPKSSVLFSVFRKR